MTLRNFASLFLSHTRVSRSHLTPEIALRLITRDCPLWASKAESSPFDDPFWAFYWPGGQAVARYILDNEKIIQDRKVLDIGCGCGAGAIAAAKMKAKTVVANDIDRYALEATKMNAEVNNVRVGVSDKNFIGGKCDDFDTILIGDMFYDEEFARSLFNWLTESAKDGKMVLIGDPGRHGLTEGRRSQMSLLASYDLPESSCIENNGFTQTTIWKITTDLL